MKSDSTANMSWVKNFRREDGKPGFLRKGVVGDWKNFLSAEQSADLDRKCAEKLKGTGIEFGYIYYIHLKKTDFCVNLFISSERAKLMSLPRHTHWL